MIDEKEEKHPSFGMLSFSRVSSSRGEVLHGSDLTHGTFIKMELRHGTKRRGISNDWYYAENLIAEVNMSQNQFSELITSMNMGNGIPVTLARTETDGEIPQPDFESFVEKNKSEFEQQAKDTSKDAEVLLDAMRDILSGSGTVKKADREELIKHAEKVVREIKNNMPYMEDSFKQAMDKTVTDAKGTIEAFYQHRVVEAGLESLTGDTAAPKLIEHED